MENLTPETRLEYYLDKIAAGGGSSGGGGIFKVTVIEEEDQYGNSIYSLDKNYTEITTAINNGMLPIFIQTLTEGDSYMCGFYYLSDYGFSDYVERYFVGIQTLNPNSPELRLFASEPTGVLHTQAET